MANAVITSFAAAAPAASATYALLRYFDKNASAAAKRSFTARIAAEAQQGHIADIGPAIISAFDRLYTHPLFSARGILRAFLISLVALLLWNLYIFYLIYSRIGTANAITTVCQHGCTSAQLRFLTYMLPMIILVNTIATYLSLFVVRRFLAAGNRSLIRSLLIAPMIGIFITIFLSAVAFNIDVTATVYLEIHQIVILPFLQFPINIVLAGVFVFLFFFFPPAFIVYLWLPLMAMGVGGARVLSWLLKAVNWAQWFIRQGNRHPLHAIGMVAAAIVYLALSGLGLVIG